MIRTIILFMVIGFYTNTYAQNKELLKEKWLFKEAVNKGIDKSGRETLNNQIINKLTFEFKDNVEFSAFLMGQNEKGTWILNEKTKNIILTTSDAKFEIAILELSNTELKLKLGLGIFIMQKV